MAKTTNLFKSKEEAMESYKKRKPSEKDIDVFQVYEGKNKGKFFVGTLFEFYQQN